MSHSGSIAGAVTAQTRPRLRFETLDSWRGICALLVAMMHFPASGWIGENAIVRNGYLFVDYFFVLSGVVIAHGYGARLSGGFGLGRFMALRLGRVWPLHAAVLLLFVAWEAARLFVPLLRGDGAAPFTGENSIAGLASSLLLLNGTGLQHSLVWNGPSWSISSEFWTYALFAGAVMLLGTRLWIALLIAIVAGPIVLAAWSTEYMDTTWHLGLVRCIYGFSLGVAIYLLMRGRLTAMSGSAKRATSFGLWTGLEIAAVAAVCFFVAFAARSPASFAAPFVFAMALVVFMHERGLVSRLLVTRPCLWLGTLSYGIYMLHIFVQSRLINAGTVAGKVLGQNFVGPFEMHGEQFYGFGVKGALFGTAVMLAMLVCVVFAAWLGNVLVEKPFQALTRRWVIGGEPARTARRHHRVETIGQKKSVSTA